VGYFYSTLYLNNNHSKIKIMNKVLFTVMLAFCSFLACNAAKEKGIDGTWKAKMGPNGDMEITFVFKVDGESLTGTVTSPMGDQEIKNGKVNGNEFSFEISMRDSSIKHTGKLDGEVIKLSMEMPEGGPGGGPGGQGPPPGGGGGGDRPEGGGPGEMTLTRVK